VAALDSVSFVIPDAALVSIMGRSGSGKSTLLRQMGLIDRPTSGKILLTEKMSRIYQKASGQNSD